MKLAIGSDHAGFLYKEAIKTMLAAEFAARPLEHWLALFDGEDVCVGPVATPAEAAAEFASPVLGLAPPLGAHTAAWRRELGL